MKAKKKKGKGGEKVKEKLKGETKRRRAMPIKDFLAFVSRTSILTKINWKKSEDKSNERLRHCLVTRENSHFQERFNEKRKLKKRNTLDWTQVRPSK